MEDGPVFIVGVPRSGTTVLQLQLCAHPDLAALPETHYLSVWMRRYPSLDSENERWFGEFWKEFTASEHFLRLRIDPDVLLKHIDSIGARSHKNIFKALLHEYVSNKGAERAVEKTPGHHYYIHQLLDWFPDCRVIWIVRDPRGVSASYQHVPWAIKNILVPARRWRSSMNAMRTWIDEPRLRVVRYEDFVASPEEVLRGICAFLGEDFVPQLLDVTKEEESHYKVSDGWERQHVVKAHSPVNAESIDKWRRELGPRQIRVVEHICRHHMPANGYEPVYDTFSIATLWCVLSAHIRLALQLLVKRPWVLLRIAWRPINRVFGQKSLLGVVL